MLCFRSVPHKPKIEGDPDAPTLLQVRVPLWMKRKALRLAEGLGKDLSEWLRDLIVTATGPRDEGKRAKGGGR